LNFRGSVQATICHPIGVPLILWIDGKSEFFFVGQSYCYSWQKTVQTKEVIDIVSPEAVGKMHVFFFNFGI
jgi:hypothetical protein